MLFNSKDRKLFLRRHCCCSLNSFFMHFNTGPLAKGPVITAQEIRTPKSSNVSLSCSIDYDGFCPQTLFWKFWKVNNNWKPLPESGKKYNVERKDTNNKCQKKFILSIFDVTEFDEGAYSCHWLCDNKNLYKRAAINLTVADDLTG